jgi:hypothetical protein
VLIHGIRSRKVKHPLHKEYQTWASMKCRCTNEKSKDYPRWGGVGIRVCSRWYSFHLFLKDMGPAPSSGHTIDRIKNKKNYEPGNCRWATRKVQGYNRKTTKLITYKGKTLCLRDWARELGIHHFSITQHLRHGRTFSEIYKLYEEGGV